MTPKHSRPNVCKHDIEMKKSNAIQMPLLLTQQIWSASGANLCIDTIVFTVAFALNLTILLISRAYSREIMDFFENYVSKFANITSQCHAKN